MGDLYELRIERTPVPQNRKCQGCVHYDGNAASKGGACEVGTMPSMCGTGSDPKYGYGPLSELSPDEIDDLATPQLSGSVGAMNEHGQLEKMVTMKRVVLGDEDLSIAQRIYGNLGATAFKSLQGVLSQSTPEVEHLDPDTTPKMFIVAKSLHELYLAPRAQKKFDLYDVLDFLKERGMAVTDDDYEAVEKAIGARTMPKRVSPDNVATVKQAPPTLAEAAHNLRTGVRKTEDDDDMEKGGEGSRGGKVARHTKSGKPVYSKTAENQAKQFDQMMQNWHQTASKTNDPEHHAIAAKQALASAYYHHHAGDKVAAHQSMDYANHHREAYKKHNHSSRTTTAIDKLHGETAKLVGHGGDDGGDDKKPQVKKAIAIPLQKKDEDPKLKKDLIEYGAKKPDVKKAITR